jgi:2-aminoadipate transaminase
MDFEISRRMNRITSSAIRELLKVTENPAVISFAGGIPAPESFPVDWVKQAAAHILSVAPEAALQYASTEGYGPLREWIAARRLCCTKKKVSAITPTPDATILRERCEAARFG